MKGKYSNKVLQKICDMIKSDSFTVAEICAKVRVSERSYYNWQKNDAQFAAAIKKAEEERMNYFAVEAKKITSEADTRVHCSGKVGGNG